MDAYTRRCSCGLTEFCACGVPKHRSLSFSSLRETNERRAAEWTGTDKLGLSFRGVELAGETGEACNVIKKIERENRGHVGSRASIEDLQEEIADVVICADLIAREAGFDLGEAVRRKFNKTSEKYGLSTRL